MPLHEYEEIKRRQNISALNASGACHICGSSSRNNKGFSHCLDNENNLIPTTTQEFAYVRTCACFNLNQSKSDSDPDYWPYSLRVCEMCIADDCTTGRIRNCGICGAVACDENCGVEMVECTDKEEGCGIGCLECRGKERFAEIDIFRTATRCPDGRDVPRMTRVCVKCLEQRSPLVKHDFSCSSIKCNIRLVPSDVMERKRFPFGSSPLHLLCEDLLPAILEFLPNNDLNSLFSTNSAMWPFSEHVAQARVEKISHEFPTGPLVVEWGEEQVPRIHLKGTNDFNIRAPEDGKTWVGILRSLEQLTSEAFYFGFQTEGDDGDRDAVCRFMQKEDKFQFSQVYIGGGTHENEENLVPRPAHPNPSDDGISIVSSHILITNEDEKVPFTVAASEDLVSGTHRFICRLFCPGSTTGHSMGSFGILRKRQNEEGLEEVRWAERLDIDDDDTEGAQKEEYIFCLKYNAESRELELIVRNSAPDLNSDISSTLPGLEGDLIFAIELAAGAARVKDTLLSVRKCNEYEWDKFLDHIGE